MAVIVDEFLDWLASNKNLSPGTFEWYRYRVQRFVGCYPDQRVAGLRPIHVEKWAANYSLSVTSVRNDLRSVKRRIQWATLRGGIDKNLIANLKIRNTSAD